MTMLTALTTRLRFDRRAALAAMFLTLVLIWLATAGARLGWLRNNGGDVLAVIWLYYVFKSVVRAPPISLATCAFLAGCLVELGQFLTRQYGIVIPYRALRIILGSTPDWWDVAAYAIGALIVLVIERAARYACARNGFARR